MNGSVVTGVVGVTTDKGAATGGGPGGGGGGKSDEVGFGEGFKLGPPGLIMGASAVGIIDSEGTGMGDATGMAAGIAGDARGGDTLRPLLRIWFMGPGEGRLMGFATGGIEAAAGAVVVGDVVVAAVVVAADV